jgi:site-specific DNA-methyltransferase (adenine-specific)
MEARLETSLNKLYVKDCLKFMKELPSECIDVIVTSPPYNIGKKYIKYNDYRNKKRYLTFMKKVAHESHRVLKEDGSFFLNVGGKPSNPSIPYDVADQFRDYYVLQNDIIWVKSIAITKKDVGKSNGLKNDVLVGHYKPIQSKYFLNNCHENIFHFSKSGKTNLDKLSIGVPYGCKSNIERWGKKEDKRDRGDIWFIPYETIQEHRPHPAVFPEKLPLMCIKLHGIKKDLVVYDPFIGIGTTATACLKLGVNYIGTDIDSNYIKIANERISEIEKQMKLSSFINKC